MLALLAKGRGRRWQTARAVVVASSDDGDDNGCRMHNKFRPSSDFRPAAAAHLLVEQHYDDMTTSTRCARDIQSRWGVGWTDYYTLGGAEEKKSRAARRLTTVRPSVRTSVDHHHRRRRRLCRCRHRRCRRRRRPVVRSQDNECHAAQSGRFCSTRARVHAHFFISSASDDYDVGRLRARNLVCACVLKTLSVDLQLASRRA